MEYRNFGTAGIKISPVCMGTAFRGRPGDATCRTAIERALDLGVNFVDCANTYQNGRSEQLVGEVLKGRRDQVVLSTKAGEPVGDGPNDRGLSRDHILREVDNSLRRLQTDYIDIYLLHHPDPTTPIEETLGVLDQLHRQGKVRYLGCCNFAAWQVCKARSLSHQEHLASLSVVQNPYHLLDRSLEKEMIPFGAEEGVGIMVYSPLAVGLLTGRFRHGEPPPPDTSWAKRPERFEKRMSPQADRVVEALLDIGQERGKTPAQVAIAWLLSRPAISTVIMGPDHPDQVDENLGAVGWSLSDEEQAKLDAASAWTVGHRF